MDYRVEIETIGKAEIKKTELIKYLIWPGIAVVVLSAFVVFAFASSLYAVFTGFNVSEHHKLSLLFLDIVSLAILPVLARLTADMYRLFKKPNVMVGATVTRLILTPLLKKHKIDFATLRNDNLVFYLKGNRFVVAEIHAECPICKTYGKHHQLKPATWLTKTILLWKNGYVYLKTVHNAFLLECEAESDHAFELNVDDLESGKPESEPAPARTGETLKASAVSETEETA